jgi:signal transduction histidine kinase/ActR/RegA family two-component response regulator
VQPERPAEDTWHPWITPGAMLKARRAILLALEHRRLEVFEYEWRAESDHEEDVRIYEARIYPDAETSVLCMVRDVTTRRRSEAETRFLGEATAVLSESLDVEQILERLSRLCVPALADLCTVDLLEDGRLRPVAIAAADMAKQALAADLRRNYPIDPDGEHTLARAIRERRSQLVPSVTPQVHRSSALDDHHAERLLELGARSALAVPLIARGTVLGVVGLLQIDRRPFTVHDLRRAEAIAERAATATENARLYRELQIASRMKDEFLGIVSHELRTPLNAVLGWSRLLQEGSLDSDRARHALEAIHRNAQAQRQLIEDLLDASRIISDKMRLDQEPLRLGIVVDAALDAVRPAVQSHGIALTTDLGLAGETVVTGDPQRLQQVFWNLLSNAVKFTPENGRIVVAGARKGTWVEVSVTDTGAGISGAFLPFVFERFRQADSTTTRAHGGLGLGLAIARHLTEQHGGTISAWSAGEGRGSTFTVRLPVNEAPADRRISPEMPPALSPASLPAALRVLVVDDDLDSRELLRTVLASGGAQVRTAASADEAIEHVSVDRPDVLISDIGMPEEDGYALLARLRRLEASNGWPPVPAIAITAYARAEDRRRALEAGYLEHLGKPVDPSALADSVRRAAEQRSRDLSAGG